GCGDIWSSPVLHEADRLIAFGIGNCPVTDTVKSAEGIEAVDPDTGALKWAFRDHRDAFDDDFGATPIVSPVPITDVTGTMHTTASLPARKTGHLHAPDA